MRGLRTRVEQAGVRLHHGRRVVQVTPRTDDATVVLDDRTTLTADAVIDASGGPLLARLLGHAVVPPTQWPAHRSTLHLPDLGHGPAARVAALRRAQQVGGTTATLALTPLAEAGLWQLSLDVAPHVGVAAAAATAQDIAAALGGQVLTQAITIARRDDGRPASTLDLATLFATPERGWCWAAWPREEHGADGVTWTWPERDRHGVPLGAVRLAGGDARWFCLGKGAVVTADAAAALRVTGTCLALGAAVGRAAALSRPPDRVR
jgi:hypothetical protein